MCQLPFIVSKNTSHSFLLIVYVTTQPFAKIILGNVIDEWKNVVHWWNTTDWGKLKPVPFSLCPSQISYGLPCDGTPASAVRGRRPVFWAVALPHISVIWLLFITCSIHFTEPNSVIQVWPTYLKSFGWFWCKLTLYLLLLFLRECFVSFVHFNSF